MQKSKHLFLKNLDAQLDTTSGKHERYIEELQAHAEDAGGSQFLGDQHVLADAFSLYAKEVQQQLLRRTVLFSIAILLTSSFSVYFFDVIDYGVFGLVGVVPGWLISIPILLPGATIISLLPESLSAVVGPFLFFTSPLVTTLFWGAIFFMLQSSPKRRPQTKVSSVA